jgi:cytochrome c oxidase subunit 1
VATRAEALTPYRPDWRRGRVASWLTTVDHKRIGILYIVTSLFFFVIGGIFALLMRAQLATPNEHFVTRNSYDELFTMHGTTMIFLVVVPILAGFANYLVPLMIGARDVAFPRLNALSYWLYVFGGLTLMVSFLSSGGASKSGWYGYPPLSEKAFSPGSGQDLWILAIHLTSLSSIIGAINFLCTIHNMRAPGMSWMRLPLFVWTIEIYSILILPALTVLAVAESMLLLDRQVGTHFFDPAHGGNAVLYQHMFWFFGHPEVYIMVLPAMGIVSEIIPVFSRKPIFGYKAVAFSTVAIGFYSMLVWAHHMFSVGLPNYLNVFFMLSSMTIAVPTGVKIFNWIATTWRGNLIFDTPLLFTLGFVGLFTIGGLSGIFLAAFPVDWQVTDTYYVVAHMHYVLFGGTAFAVFGGLYYWWPKAVRPQARRGTREAELLVDVHRLQPDVLPTAHAWPDGYAAAQLHVLPARTVLGVQPDVDDRVGDPRGRRAGVHRQRGAYDPRRRASRKRPLARGHARVVHNLASPGTQLRPRPLCDERAAAPRPAATAR